MEQIPWAKPSTWGREEKFVIDALRSNWLSDGQFLRDFETEFANLHRTKHALTVANGTDSLFLALLALGVTSGDEVIVPGFGFMAAANTVIHAGAKPVFCDVDPKTWLIDPKKMEPLLSAKTKAIIVIHTYGNVCAMDEIIDLARRKKVSVIEDVAEAIFSKYKGNYAGSLGDINSFSFQATKTITSGEGGAVLTNNDQLVEEMRLLRSHGMAQKKYWHLRVGYNFRLTNLQAAFLYAQLGHRKEIIESRNSLYQKYHEIFSKMDGIHLQNFPAEVDPVVWAFAIKLDSNFSRLNRDQIISSLASDGIECRPGFYTPDQMPIYESYVRQSSISISSELASQLICLPFFPGISDENVDRIHSSVLRLKK